MDIYNGDFIDEIGHRDHWPAEILRKNTETTETQREGFRKAVKAGVKIAYGTDAGVYPHGKNARQFRSEQHTSELQSLMRTSYAVFCLKTTTINKSQITQKQI